MQTQQVGGNGSRVAAASQSQLESGNCPELSAAIVAFEQRTGTPFETFIKQPRAERLADDGRRLVPVLSPATLNALAGGAR